MPQHSQVLLEPRKSPIQARAIASVDAVLDATVQVLLKVGEDRLTTTSVAYRAGVSVGTLYQYFPNKSALLQAALKRHIDAVTDVIERVCHEQQGNPLEQMATALITAFFEAKMKDPKTSAALYSVGSNLDGLKMAQRMGARSSKAVVAMLSTSCQPLTKPPQLVAAVLHSTLAGFMRTLLESRASEEQVEAMRRELIAIVCAYLETCCAQRSAA